MCHTQKQVSSKSDDGHANLLQRIAASSAMYGRFAVRKSFCLSAITLHVGLVFAKHNTVMLREAFYCYYETTVQLLASVLCGLS